jgi:glycosyltransferase involved in cell wall biosynthesis
MMRRTLSLAINGRFLSQPITGVQRYAHELIFALDGLLDQREDIQITVISPPLRGPIPTWRNITLQQSGKLRGHAWEQLELPRLSAGKILFCPGNTAPVASLLGRQRTVVCVHDLSYLYFPRAYSVAFRLLYNVLMPIVLRRADAVITVSESELSSIIEHYPIAASRIFAIQNGGLPSDVDDRPAATTERGDYILYVGSLSKRKNFPGMFDAACRLARRRGFRFVFVGGIPKGISATGTGIPEDVRSLITFTGQLDDKDALVNHYRRALCFLFPSFYEASPLPPIEAMACGCPVVASDISSLRERCGDAALYCDPYSVDSIERTVEQLVDDENLRAKLRTLGLRRAADFNWEKCARSTLDVIAGSPVEPPLPHGIVAGACES